MSEIEMVAAGRWVKPEKRHQVPAGGCGRERRRGALACCSGSRAGSRAGRGAGRRSCGSEQRNVIGFGGLA